MMDLSVWLATAIPVASFGAMFVAVFVFVKTKGQMDALKEGTAAWKSLAEANKATVDQLEEQLERMEAEIEDLKHTIISQQEATRIAIDEVIAGFERAGFEKRAKP